MKLDVKTLEAAAAGSVDVSDAIFGLEPRADILHRVVQWQLNKRQQGTHQAKSRGEINRTTKKLGNALGSSPAAILFGSNDLEKNFTLKEAGDKDGLEWLEAVPKSKDTTFDRIGIGLKNGTPVAMELHDSFGQVSLLSFDSFEKNPPLKVNSFSFTIPKGADVFNN